MKKSKFSEEQIARILKEVGADAKVAETCRKHGISEPTYYVWKNEYAGMEVSQLWHLKDVEAELGRLKRMHAELAPEHQALLDVLSREGWTRPDDWSHPSDHATLGYAEAAWLTNMVPEWRAATCARADRYANQRIVMGVHYPSEVEAGRSPPPAGSAIIGRCPAPSASPASPSSPSWH